MNQRILPTPGQLEFLEWEFGVFFHFGIRSFFPGHQDWDNRPMPAEAFNPALLDCEKWIRTARDAGAKYAILVCKHHDGFANWPTAYSEYSVANTPWKDGKGDLVREFTDACRAYGLKVGLYYSPAQWGGVRMDSAREYDDYFIRQISELLGNYGKIDYLWFDGCGSEDHEYDKERIIRAIRSLQPEILIFNMWDPDTRWVGNEEGYAPQNHSNLCADVDFSVMTREKEALDGLRFLPAECDCKIRDTWFDCEDNEHTLKSAEALMGMYEMSVGRGANLLLNLGPNADGRLNDSDARRLLEFGELIRKRYGTPAEGFGPMFPDGDNAWSVERRGEMMINRVVIREDLTGGEVVQGFRVWAKMPGSCGPVCVYAGETIGHKHICVLPAVRTDRITVEITRADGEVRLRDIKVYCV